MLIHLQPNQSSLKNRLIYLLEGTENSQRPSGKVEILHGDVAIFSLINQIHSRKVEYFNLLITFKESKKELECKLAKHGKNLKDLHDEILSYILPYDFDELNLLTVAHSDTDHYHWHITVDNLHLPTGKALYLPKTKLTIRLYDRLRRYVSAKYGISLGIPQPYGVEVGTKKLIEKLREKGKRGTTLKKEQVKQLITEQVKALILSGDINSRKDIEDYIEQVLGLKINRRGRSYISIHYGKTKIRLSGGIYDEQRFGQLAEKIRRGEEKDFFESRERVGELEEELRELIDKYRKLVRQRLLPIERETQRNRRFDREQGEESRRGNKKGTPENYRKEERRVVNSSEETDMGAGKGTILNTDNQTSVQANNENMETYASSNPSVRLSFRRSGGFDNWEDLGRRDRTKEVSKEVGRTGKNGEELQSYQARMAKEMEDRGYSRQARRIPLSYFSNSFGKDSWEKDLDFNAGRERRQRDYFAGTSRKILHSVRPSPPTPYRTLIQKLYSEAVVEWELKRQEELEAIKKLPPEVIFQDLRIEAKKIGHYLCIYAPWREETKPFVFIEQKPNGHYVWKDFGSGKGGTWIDFFMELYNWDYVETVRYLRERYLGTNLDLFNEISKKSENDRNRGISLDF